MNRFSQFRADTSPGTEPGTITGLAVPYDTEIVQGPIRHVIAAGAFAAQIKDPARVRVLWNHDPSQPIGKVTGLADTPSALQFVARIIDAPEVPKGAEAMALIRALVVDEVSVGFEWQRWKETRLADGGLRILHTKARLRELSVVAFGAAGQNATIHTAAAQDRPTVSEWRRIVAGLR